MSGDFRLEAGKGGQRLDVFLSERLDVSRSRLQQLIAAGQVLVNGRPERASFRLKPGDAVSGAIPAPAPARAEPEAIALQVIYEDRDIIVIDKPPGLVVHPAPGHSGGTLVNALLHRCRDLSGIGGVMRPGIVHRLDRDTSGLLVAAKNDLAHLSLAEQIKARQVKRIYLALVHGRLQPEEGRIEAPIGRHPVNRKRMAVVLTGRSRPAVTHYRVRERFNGYTLVECRLETGRTHQIRVHLAHRGYPVVGDPVYGPRRPPLNLPGQLLHACRLAFKHPRSGEDLSFEAPLPERFALVLESLRRSGHRD